MATSNWGSANAGGGGGPRSSAVPPIPSTVFSQYSACLTLLRLLKVQALKHTIKDLQQGPFGLFHILLTGKKSELQDRIIAEIDKARSENNAHLFTHIYDLIKRNSERPGYGPALESSRVIGPGNTLGSASASSSPSTSSPHLGWGHAPAPAGGVGAGPSSAAAGKGYGTYGVPLNKYNVQIPPYYGGPPTTSTAGIGQAGPRTARATFRPSPFFDVKQHVSTMALCPDAGANERKNVILTFNLTPEVQALLKDSKHQVRLFCTTLEYYNNSVSHPSRAAPTVFPLTCEARVNDRLLTANLKGNRKVSGRVPPPNLNKDSALHLDSRQNKVELSYVNTLYQRYAMICCMVQIHSIDSLVAKVRARPLTVEMVTDSILKLAEDDEIEAGAVKMTLRCPLSAMRIKIPSRSKKCLHRQCFDAETFFQLNEQTPSWSCPVCNQTLNPDDLILDQYVETILKAVPEDQDSIVVEPDASWHTEDGKVKGGAVKGSAEKGSRPNGATSAPSGARTASGGGAPNGNQRPQPDVVILDLTPSPPPTPQHGGHGVVPAPSSTANGADTSSSGQAATSVPSSSSSASVSGMIGGAQASGAAQPRRSSPIVIDLTLDSDSDDDGPTAPRTMASSMRRSSAQPPPAASGSGMPHASASSSTTSLTSAALRQQGSAAPVRNGSGGSRMDESDSGASRAASADARSVQQAPPAAGSASRANVPLRPTSHAVASTILHRRTRDETSDGQEDEEDEEDDDNIVLSPGGAGRRVRRRITVRPTNSTYEPSSRDLFRRDRGGAMTEDDEDDDEPLMPRRDKQYGGSGSAHPAARAADTSTSSNRTFTTDVSVETRGTVPRFGTNQTSSGSSANGQAGVSSSSGSAAASGGRSSGGTNPQNDAQSSSLAASTSSLSINRHHGSRSGALSSSDSGQVRSHVHAAQASTSTLPAGTPPGVYRGWRPPPPSASGREREDERDRVRNRDYRDWDLTKDHERDRHRNALDYGRDSAGPASSSLSSSPAPYGVSAANRGAMSNHSRALPAYGSSSTTRIIGPVTTASSVPYGASSVPAVVTARPAIAALPPRPTGPGVLPAHGLSGRPDAASSASSSSSGAGAVVSAQSGSSSSPG